MFKDFYNENPKWYLSVLTIIFSVYLVIWFISIYKINPVMDQDSQEYATLSDSIINKNFINKYGEYESFRTPGYPGLISLIRLISNSFFSITFVQVLLVFITSILIERIGKKLNNHTSGRIASILFIVNPVILSHSMVILSDISFTFIYILFLWLIITKPLSKMSILIASLICSISMYIRPMGLFAIPIFVIPIFIHYSSNKAKDLIIYSIILIVATTILILPWQQRNYIRTGVFSFTSLDTYNIIYYNIPMFFSFQNKSNLDYEREKLMSETGMTFESWRNLEAKPLLRQMIEEFIKDNFFKYTTYHTIRSASFFASSDIELSLYIYSNLFSKYVDYSNNSLFNPWWKFAERILIAISWCFILYHLFKKKQTWIYLMLAILIYLALLSGPVANARYRIPVMPIFYLMVSMGITEFIKNKKSLKN